MSNNERLTETAEFPIDTAPKDGRTIEVRSSQSGEWFQMHWWPKGTSWNADCSDLIQTGIWTDCDGWLQPNEVDAWRECQE